MTEPPELDGLAELIARIECGEFDPDSALDELVPYAVAVLAEDAPDD